MQFSNCIAVKGYIRAALYDLQRTRYLLVDNSFADLLFTYENKIPIDKLNIDGKNCINELIEDDWGIVATESIIHLFPKLSLKWKHYSEITNAQIDFDNYEADFDYFFSDILPQFESFSCKALQVNFLKPIDYKTLCKFLERFNDTQIHILVIFLPYVLISAQDNSALHALQPRLNFLFYYSCPPDLNNSGKNEKSFYSVNDISIRNSNIISTDYFTTNITFFSESQEFNTYYNRKICIDAKGNIKNTPEQDDYYGNIKNIRLDEVINIDTFKSFWNVHKDMIDVCKDCEYRHMCVDSCSLSKRKDNTWYRVKECNYNPYIAKWSNEDGYKKLAKCGVDVSAEGFMIDKEKLAFVNEELWG